MGRAFLQYHGEVLNVDAGLAMGRPQHGGWDPSFFIYCLFLHLLNGTGQSCSRATLINILLGCPNVTCSFLRGQCFPHFPGVKFLLAFLIFIFFIVPRLRKKDSPCKQRSSFIVLTNDLQYDDF